MIFAIALSFVGSTSHALYLGSMGPKACCKSHCHHGKATTGSDAERCCATHLGVLPSGLGAKAPDIDHVFAAVGTAMLAPVPTTLASAPLAPAPAVLGRGSPPGSLVAAHTSLSN